MKVIKQRLVVSIASIIMVFIGMLYFVLYHPLITELKKTSADCQCVECELRAAQETIDFLKQNGIKRTLASEEEVSAAIEELTQRGKERAIDFISITPQKSQFVPENAAYKVIPVEIEISGAYDDIGEFLGEVDSFEKSIVTINNFRIMADRKNSSKIEAMLILNIYLSGD